MVRTPRRPRRQSWLAAATLSVLLGATACTTDPDTGQRVLSRGGKGALAGAAGGALLGGAFGGKKGALIGAGVGSIAGGAVGGYMDRQERAMRQALANSKVNVDREGDELKLTFPDNITFDVNSAIVRPELRPSLEQVARVLNEYPSTVIGVFGHTDNTGSAEYNQRLSERRARSVADTLVGFGVNPARIETRGFGFNQPVASNATPEGRARNRRVEIRVIPVSREDVSAGRLG
ncbi:MAG: OmpA family protein [Sphingomonadaceae bacterium]|uniref:OmpA family protein n=1 Tax=Thermaurantiacus sp. TaxID=2820283 RepID=UPI00298EE56A|nr:OmpA family protein [Thermaurantiacus sp.]MCS6987388.1 OmpA family protein [Sphingomonadaceae bacterium]MDW8415308.1 OmpA family protein [Thermaurantiacus sp.]